MEHAQCVVAGAELEGATQLAISITGALAQPECAALPPGDVVGAATVAHVATRLSAEPVAQVRIASVAAAVLSPPKVQGLQLDLVSPDSAGSALFVVRIHRSCNSARS